MPPAALSLDFRPFECQDASLLGRWLAAAGLGVPKGVADRTWARRLISDPNISCWAALDKGETTGFFRLDTGPDQTAELTLIVSPDLLRSGVGSLLLAKALEHARARGISRILAVVNGDNSAALWFFGDAGFVASGSKTPGNIHLHRLIHQTQRANPLEIQP